MDDIVVTRILSSAEFNHLGQVAVERNFYRNDPRIFIPGMAWYMDWVWDPTGQRQATHKHVMCKHGSPFLSDFYWHDWSTKRPPICVVGPDGDWWEIDRKSKDGSGWMVTGDLPNITCAPSIVLTNYHGFLQGGKFTPDLERRDQQKTYQDRCDRCAIDRTSG